MGKTSYTPAQVDQGLLALILYGSAVKASEALKAAGKRIPEQTLRDWRHKHADRLAELHDQYAPQLEAEMIRQQRAIALAAQTVAFQAVEQTAQDLADGTVKDASSAAKNLQTTAAIATDKFLALTGRPSTITEHRSVDELTRKLEQLGVIEATATEEPLALQPTSEARSSV